ncbi:hypothetical protein BGX27_010225 [Mortierella sp. AM989]|nr:hypothetical protein BGX27_010225 [Mortierella sp. AM989]
MWYDCTCRDGKECRHHKYHYYFNTLNLICHNPKLQRIKIEHLMVETPGSPLFDNNILRSLSKLQYLRCLEITASFNLEQWLQVLGHLPASLEELDIFTWDEFSDIRPLQVTAQTNLRRLAIQYNNLEHIVPLLKQSPLLEDVTFYCGDQDLSEFITALTSHCPRIHSICLNNLEETLVDLTSIMPQIFDTYRKLRALGLYSGSSYFDQIQPSMAPLHYSANTLVSLRLDFLASGADAGIILRTFPNLRVFVLGLLFVCEGESGVSLHDLLYERKNGSQPASPAEAQHIPWACRNLEEFKCDITSSSGPNNAPPEEERAWTARQVGQLYQELRILR